MDHNWVSWVYNMYHNILQMYIDDHQTTKYIPTTWSYGTSLNMYGNISQNESGINEPQDNLLASKSSAQIMCLP